MYIYTHVCVFVLMTWYICDLVSIVEANAVNAIALHWRNQFAGLKLEVNNKYC